MFHRIQFLTEEQQARIPEWVERWRRIGLRTGPADRPRFEAAVERCYRLAGLAWEGRVVWVSSPLVVALAAPVAACVVFLLRHAAFGRQVKSLVLEALDGVLKEGGAGYPPALPTAVHTAVEEVMDGAICGRDSPENFRLNILAAPAEDCYLQERGRDLVDQAVKSVIDRSFNPGPVLRNAIRCASHAALRKFELRSPDGRIMSLMRASLHGLTVDSFGVEDEVAAAIGSLLRSAPQVQSLFEEVVRRVIEHGWQQQFEGQLDDLGDLAYWSFLREVCAMDVPGNLWERRKMFDATAESACWWWPHRNFVIACERPQSIHQEHVPANRWDIDQRPRPHCDDGPVIAWPDGWGIYVVRGVRIPYALRHIVEQPEYITVAEIEAESNVEIRRMMIDRYGSARYVQDSGATVVHGLPTDHPLAGLRGARLLRKEVANDQPIVYVDLLNSTPEPDGSVKRYMLRVDANAYFGEAARNAHAAAASTWRNADGSMVYEDWRDYQPAAES